MMKVHCSDRVASANVKIYAAYEDRRGVAPDDGHGDGAPRYVKLPRDSAEIGRIVGFADVRDNELGRDAGDPVRNQIDAGAQLTVGLDKRFAGFHFGALFGPATTTNAKAWGFIQFRKDANRAGATVTLNGVDWEMVASGATGPQTNIGATLADTLTQLAADLNASADAAISSATYRAQGWRLWIEYGATGGAGEAYTLAVADPATGCASAATLKGGTLKRHIFKSGATCLPSETLISEHEGLGFEALPYRTMVGARAGSLSLDMQSSGAAAMQIGYTAINETASDLPIVGRRQVVDFAANPTEGDTISVLGVTWTFSATPSGAAETEIKDALPETLAQLAADLNASSESAFSGHRFSVSEGGIVAVESGYTIDWAFERWSNLQGGLLVDGECVAGVVESGSLSYDNGLSADRTLDCGCGEGGTIYDAIPGDAATSWSAQTRFYSSALHARARAGEPVEIFYMFFDPSDGSALKITLPRVFLPEARRSVQTGQLVAVALDGRASGANGAALQIELINDVEAY